MYNQATATQPSGAPAVVVASAPRAVTLDVQGMPYREMNAKLRELVQQGAQEITLRGVMGQRYLGTNLQKAVRITVEGVPGQDLGAFMDGPFIEVHGDAQDGCGNTMNAGTLVIHGSAGDIAGHSMRGGRIFVRGNVGYRVGIHMKEYGSVRPIIVIGGTAQHFLGEYMSGGVLIVLGSQLAAGESHPSKFVGTGMHGGAIYLRGTVDTTYLGREVGQTPLDAQDEWLLQQHVNEFARYFGVDAEPLLKGPFVKLLPLTKRPYGRLYAY
jgi:glutamate synthase domain-containing protein 3